MAVVYTHQRLDNNEVFYVGIGKTPRRAFSKLNRNKYWKNIVDKVGYTVDIKVNDATWDEAIQIEKYLIAFYGRKDLGRGSLVNMTDGGDGMFGLLHTKESKEKMSKSRSGEKNWIFGKTHLQETKQKISEAKKGDKNHNFGKHFSDEHKQKLSESNKGKIVLEETKQKMSEAKKGKKQSPEFIAKRIQKRLETVKANKLKKLNII